jgi:hypothetical protein
MELLFERFLSEERGEWPDIDIDLPSGDQRERVIQHIYQLYGQRGAAMTANVITYRNRMAAREMGKAMGFDPELKISAALRPEFRTSTRLTAASRCRTDLNHPRLRSFRACTAVQDRRATGHIRRNGHLPGDAGPASHHPPMPDAWWCSGIKKIAPTWASSRSTCSGSA